MINIQTVICQILAQATPPAAAPAAAAAATQGAPEQPAWMPLVMMLLMFAGMWFLLIAPQRKRQKEMEKLQSELAIGDNVIAAGGIYGRVVAIKESRITLELEDGRLTVHKSAIAGKADDASAIVQG
jgi:preprotein translocase subunit YajC